MQEAEMESIFAEQDFHASIINLSHHNAED